MLQSYEMVNLLDLLSNESRELDICEFICGFWFNLEFTSVLVFANNSHYF